jgi:hypothetical protein
MAVARIARQSLRKSGRRFAWPDRIARPLLGVDRRTADGRDQDER